MKKRLTVEMAGSRAWSRCSCAAQPSDLHRPNMCEFSLPFSVQNGDILQPLTRTGEDTETPVEWVACEPGGIDRQMLLDQSSPILMYDDVVLFEDFIHDHGVVRLSVKTRVMPGFWFVLLRYWLRVDGVVMKVCMSMHVQLGEVEHIYNRCK